MLKKYSIIDHRTHPYTPQENGKIERWWWTLERKQNPKTELNEEYLSRLVKHYNNSWPNRSLKALLKKKSTPLMAWNEI